MRVEAHEVCGETLCLCDGHIVTLVQLLKFIKTCIVVQKSTPEIVKFFESRFAKELTTKSLEDCKGIVCGQSLVSEGIKQSPKNVD